MMKYKETLLEAGQAFRMELVGTDPDHNDLALVDTHLATLKAEVDQLRTAEENQRVQILLEQIIQEFKTKPHTPELVTAYWRTRWNVLGSRVGLKIEVSDSPYYQDEISDMEHLAVPRVPIYVPSQLTKTPEGLILLGKMHPNMRSWSTQEGTTVKHTFNQSGWIDIESDWKTPHTNTTQKDLENLAKQNKLRGQRLATYIIGSQNSYDLTGHYFDEEGWVRLLGSRYGGQFIRAGFRRDGYLSVGWRWDPQDQGPDLGGRFEGVKRS